MSFNAFNTCIGYYIFYALGMAILVPTPTDEAKAVFWIGLVVVTLFIFGLYVPVAITSGDVGCLVHMGMAAGIALTVVFHRRGFDPVVVAATPWAACFPLPALALLGKAILFVWRYLRTMMKTAAVRAVADPASLKPYLVDDERTVRARARAKLLAMGLPADTFSEIALFVMNAKSVPGDEKGKWMVLMDRATKRQP